ncbi:hypothetical protein GUITHDRAFT_76562 [Guillardia theta CCMP2712]|uniref:Non-haem dioxygenase N-terminal domain-containing protein n=1 Tax=Guillardia theta (strain CCMP2712) TaxID=905079 RepID=L1IT69_GUITC|nr:hypothetical protein GUITHDRAFT_76562 [Guillardia theta CCMP2712]EKX39267.1 hypothetical protein GUITHDRAFT_76562 [Guillardia theta CCMP2712]|eukprot:XP_005826247.1 hypothetical protein GUITHDRAFT_76562 [Guillardia theta CCMP2712]
MGVPVVDMAGGEEEAARRMSEACREFGFFYLVGHGVEEELRAKLYEEMRRFFALPEGTKEKYHTRTNSYNRGWTPMEEETLDPSKQTRGDTKEGYYIGREIPLEGHPMSGKPLHGPNVWPSEEELPGWKETMERYFESVSMVGHRLLRLLALSQPMLFLRLLHYSEIKSSVDEEGKGVYACGEHTDYGMITLLSTDENPGLQIKLKDGQWIDIPPRKVTGEKKEEREEHQEEEKEK